MLEWLACGIFVEETPLNFSSKNMPSQSFSEQQNNHLWLEKILNAAQPLISEDVEKTLIVSVLNAIFDSKEYDTKTRRNFIAAAFDLVVAAEYYRSVAHIGWIYCPDPIEHPLLIYPYTNACPRCILKGNFTYHTANKPKSGSIGAKTSRLLALFLQELFVRKGLSIEVLKGAEPVDVVFRDNSTSPTTIFFAEIKAAPLVTLPLVVKSQPLTIEEESTTKAAEHGVSDNSQLFGSEIGFLVPVYNKKTKVWQGQVFNVGAKLSQKDETWAYQGLINLLESTPSFLKTYFEFWQVALKSYGKRDQSAIFWLTNACGQPSPRPEDWPRRKSASGYESISDGKTSVGMDRTDDLKKATYQVLKIGAEGKPSDNYLYKVGVVSNIHAVRHFDDYMGTLKDIIWTRDEAGDVTKAKHLAPNTELFNLFDGLIALTETLARDKWVRKVFDF
ncbi:MAG: hypothetical protein GY797_29465 [Deltaproteobacteria bacterium]|nr:hypothetical protein [Deltaproteobacteria bacterium]